MEDGNFYHGLCLGKQKLCEFIDDLIIIYLISNIININECKLLSLFTSFYRNCFHLCFFS